VGVGAGVSGVDSGGGGRGGEVAAVAASTVVVVVSDELAVTHGDASVRFVMHCHTKVT
jgi:hypothetical protein